MQVKILCIYDEGAVEDMPYIGAKGFSLLVDLDGQRTLFDTGMRPRYLSHNMAYLDIKPESIDRVVISHVHRDHTGGLEGLLIEKLSNTDIFAPASAKGSKGIFRTHGLYISPEFKDRVTFKEVDDWVQISENLFITPPISYEGGDECFLVIMSKKGPIVLSGCSHCGVEAVIAAVKERFGIAPKTYIGGIHLMKKEKSKAQSIAEIFKDAQCLDLWLNHCTSREGMTELRVCLGLNGVKNFYVGMTREYEV
jgi:7,8-dihydropterin-6-yl-methyl-4-(beta-D-ribofuranosyl)aminobenzene 5'-phosphate synthase